MGDLGRYFNLSEFERTSTGLPNQAPSTAVRRLRLLVVDVLDPLRANLGRPVHVTSGYRTRQVNATINGSRTSQHMRGEAADIKVHGLSASAIVETIIALGLPVDQVIAYAPERGGHVHVSRGSRHRRQVLWAPKDGGYTEYIAVGVEG